RGTSARPSARPSFAQEIRIAPGQHLAAAADFGTGPMKHAVIIAHPNRTSLTHSAARAYAEAAEALGHEVIVRDLYAMDFDPRLQAAEIPQDDLPSPAED